MTLIYLRLNSKHLVKSKDFFTPTLKNYELYAVLPFALKIWYRHPKSTSIPGLFPTQFELHCAIYCLIVLCMINAVTTKRISHISLVQQIGQIYRCNLQSLSVTIMTSHKLLCKISDIVPYYTTITVLVTTESLLLLYCSKSVSKQWKCQFSKEVAPVVVIRLNLHVC